MSEETQNNVEAEDSKADLKAVLIVFTTLVVMAVHFVSGFSFDF